jgi:outer membrane biosynthesis protein TonB
MAAAQEIVNDGSTPGVTGAGTGSGIGDKLKKEYLAGRKVAESPITPALSCQERGTVVLTITVDRAGKVLEAEMGRGTSNPAQCLIDYATSIALATKFNASEEAPEKQVGYIQFNFKDTE